jgi:hypothetical protein
MCGCWRNERNWSFASCDIVGKNDGLFACYVVGVGGREMRVEPSDFLK